MSPTDRDLERARAKRRYDKRQAALAARATEQRRNRQVVVVVAAVVLVVAGFVALSTLLGRTGPATSAASTGLAAGCTTPPAAPGTAPKEQLPAKSLAGGRTWTARITTTCGAITVDLDGAKAPQTVSSFIALARSGFYAKSPCHRLTTSSIYVLQCGDPTGTGNGGPGYGYGIENAPASGNYPTGTLAMARTSDPKSNGSQFFLVYKPTALPTTGGGYSIFGHVTSGMDVVTKVAAKGAAGGSGDGPPLSKISILSVAVAEKKA